MQVKNDAISLKEDSHYFYQVQGQLHITKRVVCYFFIYTSKWTYIQTINYDHEFWTSKMESPLKLSVV